MYYDQLQYNIGINYLLKKLVKQVANSGQKYDFIVGINRGGLIPATSISYGLHVPLIPITLQTRDCNVLDLAALERIPKGSLCLVVDDIVDTGSTLKILLDIWDKGAIHTACLVYNEGQQEITPTFYDKKINKEQDSAWVTFWWDNY